jgi:hypothetical protein
MYVCRQGADACAVLVCPSAFRVQCGRKIHSPENTTGAHPRRRNRHHVRASKTLSCQATGKASEPEPRISGTVDLRAEDQEQQSGRWRWAPWWAATRSGSRPGASQSRLIGSSPRTTTGRSRCGDSGVRRRLKKAARGGGCDFPGFGLHSFRRANITIRQEVGGSVVQLKRQDELARAIPDRTNDARKKQEETATRSVGGAGAG